MKATLQAAIAAATMIFVGCTTEPEESFKEIRVDAFSHYWESQKAIGVVKPGNRIVRPNLDSIGTGYVDTLILVTAEDDKTSSLPPHTHEVVSEGASRLVYTVDEEPQDISCYLDNGGRSFKVTDQATALFDFRTVSTAFQEGEADELTRQEYWYHYEEAPQTRMVGLSCGYLKGKGFYFGSVGSDFYADNPYFAGGTLIIRYR